MHIKSGLAILALALLSACGGQDSTTPPQSRKQAAALPAVQNTWVLSGYRDEYRLLFSVAGVTATHITSGKVTTIPATIKFIQFDDISVAFDTSAEQIYRLYRAAFDRAPDANGLAFWLDALQLGISLEEIANAMIASDEFKAKHGVNPAPEVYVNNLYANVLHRAPDPSGLSFWTTAAKNGVSRARILQEFAQSPENTSQVAQEMVQGVELAVKGVAYRPVAVAPIEVQALVGAQVVLDGSRSRDANNDKLTYSWAFQPTTDSASWLQGGTSAKSSFVPDRTGLYKATLTVRDAQFESKPKQVLITVTAPVVATIADSGIYRCNALSSSQALALYYQGHTYLDRDHDGKPCESSDKTWENNQSTGSTGSTGSTSSGLCWVNGYRRSNGTWVSGYYRRC